MSRKSLPAGIALLAGMANFGVTLCHGSVVSLFPATTQLRHLPLNSAIIFGAAPVWTSPMTAVMLATVALLSLAILAVLSRVNKLRRQVSEQEGALEKADRKSVV